MELSGGESAFGRFSGPQSVPSVSLPSVGGHVWAVPEGTWAPVTEVRHGRLCHMAPGGVTSLAGRHSPELGSSVHRSPHT